MLMTLLVWLQILHPLVVYLKSQICLDYVRGSSSICPKQRHYGQVQTRIELILPLVFVAGPKVYVNAFGICFSTDQNISYSKNLESRLLSLEKCLNVWSSRDLTLHGKINIVKSLALSKLTFVATVLPISDDFIKKC